MRNIGPKTQSWLKRAGIETEQDLIEVGALEVYLRLKALGFNPTLNALWALEGACQGIDWRDIPAERKMELKQQLTSPEP